MPCHSASHLSTTSASLSRPASRRPCAFWQQETASPMWHSSSGDSAPSRDREHEKVQGWMEPASEDELWHERCYRRLRCTEMAMNMLRAIMRIWHDRNIISVCAVHNVRTRHKMYPFALAAPYRCDHTAKLVSPSARNQRSELCRCRMPPTVGLRPTTHFGGFPAQQATDVAKQPCEALKSAPPTCLAGNGLQTATATVRRPGEHKDKRASMAGGGENAWQLDLLTQGAIWQPPRSHINELRNRHAGFE